MNNQGRSTPMPGAGDAPREERRGGKGGRMGMRRMPRVCPFCHGKIAQIDYKDVDLLRRYLSERGKIKPRRKIGACARHQRRLSLAVKRARHIALLPYSDQHARG